MRLTVFASSSSGNCALLRGGGVSVLIDAGISCTRICKSLADAGSSPEELAGILITHEHSDHVSGLAVMSRQHPVAIYAPGVAACRLQAAIPGVTALVKPIEPEAPFSLGGMKITAFPTPHDSVQSVGYRFEADGQSFVLCTDTGCVTKTMLRYLVGADAVLIEANHDEQMLRDGPYPAMLKRRILSDSGHLSNALCAKLAGYLAGHGTKTIVIGHLSKENNTPMAALAAVAPMLEGSGALLLAAPAFGRLDIEVGCTCSV